MAYIWSKDLETGNNVIDQQHKQLIDALNNLINACTSGKGRTELESTLKFLSDYTVKHFADEERLQLKYLYPDRAHHKKLHDDFKLVVKELAEQLKKEGPTAPLVGRVNSKIGTWLITHIKKEDKKLAEYIRSKSAG